MKGPQIMVLIAVTISTPYVWMQVELNKRYILSKMVWPCWGAVTAGLIPTAGVMGHQPRSSVYKPVWGRPSVQGHFRQTYLLATKTGGKWKLALRLLGLIRKNKWTKELLAKKKKNYWLNSTVTMLSNWMKEAALCNIRALDLAWEDSSSATWLFWALVSIPRKWGQHYLHYFLSLSLWRSK